MHSRPMWSPRRMSEELRGFERPVSIRKGERVMDRRAFLQSSAAVSAAGLSAASAAAFAAPGGSHFAGRAGWSLASERFIIDTRFAEAVATGRAAQSENLRVAEVSGDMSNLWYHDLDLRWRDAPMVLAGVTAPEGLFVLETLANDRGMRVVYRGVHTVGPAGVERHVLRGPGELVALLANSRGRFSASGIWGTHACAALRGCPASSRAAVESLEFSTPAHPDRRDVPASPSLVSWIIAPRGTAATVAPI
jgi:hypothetical protein